MMEAANSMQRRLHCSAEDVNTNCNDLGLSVSTIEESSKSIKSDFDSVDQDVSSNNSSITPAMLKDSHKEFDDDLFDSGNESSELTPSDPWSYKKLMETSEWTSSFGGLKLPHNWDKLKRTDKMEILENKVQEFFPNLPKTLVRTSVGSMFPEDSGILPGEVPNWLDREKFARGQRFAIDNSFGMMHSLRLSLYLAYSFEDIIKPIILTGRSADPYSSSKRFLSTAKRMRKWMTSDPWTEGTPAYRDIQSVRRLHASIRKKIKQLGLSQFDEATKIDKPLAVKTELLLKDFRDACPVATPGQCPHLMPEYAERRPTPLNQGGMSSATFAFMSLVILYPEAFGIHDAKEEDLDAFCHVWRGLTYLLGIFDEFNFCNGSLAEIKQRSRDFLDYWVLPNLRDIPPEYEHMMRCLYEGLDFYLPGTTYDGELLYLTEILGFEMPRLRASVTYSSWFKFNFNKALLRYGCQLKWIKNYFNREGNAASDRALAFDDEKHAELREKSDKIVAAISADLYAK